MWTKGDLGITVFKICSGNGGMIVLGREDRVGDGVSKEKFACSSKGMLLYPWAIAYHVF